MLFAFVWLRPTTVIATRGRLQGSKIIEISIKSLPLPYGTNPWLVLARPEGQWLAMAVCWDPQASHNQPSSGGPWLAMAFPWLAMAFCLQAKASPNIASHGQQLPAMARHCRPWLAMASHDQPLPASVKPASLWKPQTNILKSTSLCCPSSGLFCGSSERRQAHHKDQRRSAKGRRSTKP